MNVVNTFGFVVVRSARNRIVTQLKRLKQPRYLLATLLGLGWWWLYLGRNVTELARDSETVAPVAAQYPAVGMATFTLFGLVSVLAVWVFGSSQAALTFTEAEIQFFFPAPATRRTLLNYKLLKSAGLGLITTAFFALIFGRAAGHRLFFVLGFWLALTTLSLHSVAAGRTRQALAENGLVGWKQYGPTVLVLLTVAGALWWAVQEVGPLPAFEPKREWVDQALRVLEAPPLGWLLWPARAFAQVIFAPDGTAFVRALPGALAVTGVHYAWVLAGDVSFEENSLKAAERRARMVEAVRSGRGVASPTPAGKRRPPFILRPHGRPEVALIWKGLIASGRLFNTRALTVMLVAFLPMVVVLGFITDFQKAATMMGFMLLVFWAMSTLAGGALSRSDLRRDLEYIDVLRALPLSGRQVVLGEALGALVPAAAIQWALLLFGLLLLRTEVFVPLSGEQKVIFGIAGAIVGPALTLGSILVQNAAVIFVPGWVSNPRSGPQGPEASGVAMLVLIGTLIGVAVGLLPALVVAGLMGLATWPLLGLWAVVPAAATLSGVAAVEGYFAATLLGAAFERSEPGT